MAYLSQLHQTTSLAKSKGIQAAVYGFVLLRLDLD